MSRLRAYYAALAASLAEPPVQLVPFYSAQYDDRDPYLTFFPDADWFRIGHGAFYNGTLTRLPADRGGTIANLSFQLATSGQADEGFDIGGVVENITISVYANGQLLTRVTGEVGGDVVKVRCGPGGLATRPKRYKITVFREPPADTGNGRSLYIDYLKIYSRALY